MMEIFKEIVKIIGFAAGSIIAFMLVWIALIWFIANTIYGVRMYLQTMGQ